MTDDALDDMRLAPHEWPRKHIWLRFVPRPASEPPKAEPVRKVGIRIGTKKPQPIVITDDEP